jgi:hypothetical protein
VRKTLTIWLCVMILGAAAAAARQAAADDARVGIWTGTWEGEGSTGGFELTIEKSQEGPIGGHVSVIGEPAYKATLKTLAFEGDKLSATYDFTPAPEAEVVLTGTLGGGNFKGTWIVREKAGGTTAAQGTWTVAKK